MALCLLSLCSCIFYLGKHSLKCLFKKRRIEAVPHYHVTTSIVTACLHLKKTSLIQCTTIDIYCMAIFRGPSCKTIIVLYCFFHIFSSIFFNIMMTSDREFQLVIENLSWALRA